MMKRCQKCNFQSDSMLDYCWQCGSQLIEFSNAGNFNQNPAPTQAFNAGTQNNYARPTQQFNQYPNNYAPNQNNYAPNYQAGASSTNYGTLAAVLGGLFIFLMLLSGVGAFVMYQAMARKPVKPDYRQDQYRNDPVKTTEPSKDTSKDVKSTEPGTSFEKIWIDYNVKENGRLGMRIHVKFSVYNLKGVDSNLALYFQKDDGTKLKTTNKKFASTDGQVAVYRAIKPSYDSTVYEDLDAFIPYDEFKLSPGKYNLKIDADVIYKDGGLVEHLAYQDFQYEKFNK